MWKIPFNEGVQSSHPCSLVNLTRPWWLYFTLKKLSVKVKTSFPLLPKVFLFQKSQHLLTMHGKFELQKIISIITTNCCKMSQDVWKNHMVRNSTHQWKTSCWDHDKLVAKSSRNFPSLILDLLAVMDTWPFFSSWSTLFRLLLRQKLLGFVLLSLFILWLCWQYILLSTIYSLSRQSHSFCMPGFNYHLYKTGWSVLSS